MSEEVTRWLGRLGLGQYAHAFEEGAIDWDVLPSLDHEILKELGVESPGHRLKLLNAIQALGSGATTDAPSPHHAAADTVASEQEAERRQLTVMFCDLAGSTELSQKLDPEDMRDVNRAFQDACKAAIDRYQGYVARYMGDGVLAYFGYPRAHEDDSERAVRASLDIINAMGGINDGIGREHGIEVAVRVGVATGPVVVGDLIGEGAAQESAVVGETPNLASRLQNLAERNSIFVAPNTHRLTLGYFRYEDLGERTLKGIAEPVHVWKVLGEGVPESRFEALHGRRLIPLVGRQEEVDILLGRWGYALDGDGQVVLICGEPGIGKSRLCEAICEELLDRSHTRLRYQCSPHYMNSALYPIIVQLEQAAQFTAHDNTDTKLAKLKVLLHEPDTVSGEDVASLASLLSLSREGDRSLLELQSQQQREKTLAALLNRFEQLSSRLPMLAIFEDLHWVDPSTLELLDRLIERAERLPILLLLTFRPEFSATWTEQTHVSLMALKRLSRRQSGVLVERVAGTNGLAADVQAEIVTRSDGVPLFIEELTRAVLESEESDVAHTAHEKLILVPSTLQDSLMARLDRLGPGKHVAQIGATIGREFTVELLRRVSDHAQSSLENGLQELVDAGLVYRRVTDTEGPYTFKHALIQDAAYNSQLRRTRRELHSRIAQALERIDGPTTEAAPELLGHHFTEAGNHEKAIGYWQRAVERAIRRSALKEAQTHANKALAVLIKLPRTAEHSEVELSLLLSLGIAQQALTGAGSVEVERIYTTARDLCNEVGEPWQRFSAVWGLWRLHESRADYRLARRYADELLEVARASDDAALVLQAHHAHWTTAEMSADLPLAAQHAEEGLRIYKSDEHAAQRYVFGGHDPAVCALGTIATVSWLMGYPDRATHATERALTRARELNHPLTLANCLTNAICHYFLLSRQSAELIQAVARELREDLSGKTEDQSPELGTSEEYRLQGKLLRSISGGSHHEAETWFERALACAHGQQARSLELRAAMDLARLQASQGRGEAAVETIKRVYDQFTEGFDTADLRDAKALLESVS